ncbi:MAG TPA: recombinase zinc beta ribbon domain-containing protein, partial [Puia sp.]
ELIQGRPGHRSRPKADFPLRGILRCQCGAHMTASYSKGKKKYYMYYQCTEERGKVIRGDFIHDRVEEVLAYLSFTDEQVAKIVAYAKEELRKATNYRTESIKGKERDLKEMQGKIEKLEEKMINDLIEPATYRVWFAKLSREKAVLESQLMQLQKADKSVMARLDEAIPLLTNLRNLYISCSLEGQQLLLRKVFEVGFMFDGTRVRTPSLNSALIDNYLKMKEKGPLLVEQPDAFLTNSYSCTA